jgi:DNA adenine methylase
MAIMIETLQKPQPFLKWAGGKRKLLDQYQPYFPKQLGTYHEPFLGGGAVFFHLQPQQAVLSDINPELVNVYRCVREQLKPLIKQLEFLQAHHSEEQYYRVRRTAYSLDLDRAANFIYLNKTCFNGLYRQNLKGEFNVPMGRYRNPSICQPEILRAASVALQSAQLRVQSFEEVLGAAQPGDFVYFDPPYHPLSETSNFVGYTRHSFTLADQTALFNTFSTLHKQGVKLMLSSSDCPFIRELYQGFEIITISAPRSINSNGQKRGNISEVLVLGNIN